ncbi:apolipoprotein N-acyltransferase [bacterium]|nr:apolipoprotein N-acyltransferase [bacterium]
MSLFFLCSSALLLVLAFPRANLFPIAWFALVPFIIVIKGRKPINAFFLGWFFGFVFIGCLLYWILIFGIIPWIALSLFEGFYFALISLFFSLLKREDWQGALIFASIWTGFDYLRSLGRFGFTWGSLAQSQYLDTPLLGICKIGGMFLLTFILAMHNGFLALLPLKRGIKSSLLTLIIAHIIGFGMNILYHPKEGNIRVAVTQAGIGERVTRQAGLWSSPSIDELMRAYEPMLRGLPRQDLIVFSETAFPVSIPDVQKVREWVENLAREKNSYVLIGSPIEEKGRIYNSALLFSPDGKIMGRYDKVQLVPFGEFVPWRKIFPWLKKLGVRDFDFTPGKGWHPLECKGFSLGPIICFESIFPRIAREYSIKGADILVVITNDSWFGRTWAGEQHLAFSSLRACEEGRYLLRATTTGISAIIAPDGKILKRAGLFVPAVLVGKVGEGKNTPYTYLGDYILLLLFLPMLITIFGFRKTGKQR